MAGDWIKFRKKLIRDGRVLKIARKCNAARVTAIGALVTLWCLGDEYCEENGALLGYTKADLDAEIGVPGFVDALPPDWFCMDGDTPQLPMYQQHNGETAKQRAMTANRVLRHRRGVEKCNASTVTKSLPEKRREEKRRIPPPPPTPASQNGQGGGDGGGVEIDWTKAKATANATCKALGISAPKEGKYRRLVIQAAALADSLGQQWLDDANEDTRLAKPQRPWQYWAACLRTGAENRGIKLDAVLATLSVPAEYLTKEKP